MARVAHNLGRVLLKIDSQVTRRQGQRRRYVAVLGDAVVIDRDGHISGFERVVEFFRWNQLPVVVVDDRADGLDAVGFVVVLGPSFRAIVYIC